MKQLFPVGHVMGYIFSLFLTLIAVSVVIFDIPNSTGTTILIVTAIAQSIVQLILFMHIGETAEKSSLYTNIVYALFVGLITIIGSWAVLVWAK